MKKSYLVILISSACFVLLISACAGLRSEAYGEDLPASTPAPGRNLELSSVVMGSSIYELAKFSDLVVVGRLVSLEGRINTTRSAGDTSKPHPRFYGIGQVLKVEIDQTLKGKSEDTILVIQYQGTILMKDGKTPAAEEIENTVQRGERTVYIPLSLDAEYLFFLRILDHPYYDDLFGDSSVSAYSRGLEPWIFKVLEDQSVVPQSLISEIKLCFPPQTLDYMIEAMNKPDLTSPCSNPYFPPPVEEQRQESPYP